ncbi:hypothetical protein A6R68_13309, partial [Neotoma lepida]
DALRTGGRPGSRTVALFRLQVLPWLRNAAMDSLESYRGFTTDRSLNIHSTTDTVMGISIYSSNISSGHYMSLAGIGAASGIAVGALEWNVVTLPEYLRKRFGSLRIQVFFSVFFLIIYILSRISMEISFGAMFLKMVWNTDIYQTVLVLLTITGLYTITGGLTAVAYVETLQGGIMLLGSALLTGYAFHEVGGYEGLLNKYFQAIPNRTQQGNWTAKPQCYMPRQDAFHIFRSHVSGDIPWPGLILGATTVSLFYGCADQVSVQRFLAGKSKLHMKGGCLLCGYLKLLLMFFMVMPGMISRILFSDQVACVVPSECQKFCGRRTGCSILAYPMLVIGLMPSEPSFMAEALARAMFTSPILGSFWVHAAIERKIFKLSLSVGLIHRFFVIILLTVTIVWVPTMEMTSSEALFEYIQVLKSCLTPSVTAVFLLAVFCKRVNEQGAFWGLILGSTIGVFRLLAEFFYGPSTCEEGHKCPLFICSLHYLYFGFLLFFVTLLIILAISLVTKPIRDEHVSVTVGMLWEESQGMLHGLCWSLRNSRQRRVALDKEMSKVTKHIHSLGKQSCVDPEAGSAAPSTSFLPHHFYPRKQFFQTEVLTFFPLKCFLGLLAHMSLCGQ